MEELVWHRGHNDFKWDTVGDSISFLKHLKYLEISSKDATWTALIKSLVNFPSLETVIFPHFNRTMGYSSSMEIPDSQLPSLKHLKVASLPLVRTSKPFFSALCPSGLKLLEISEVWCSQLEPLTSISSLEEFVIKSLLPENLERVIKSDLLGEVEAANLIKVLSRANSLKILRLRLQPDNTNYKFWETLISSMTPLSSFNVRKGLDDQSLIMPNLETLELGDNPLSSPSTRLNERALDSEISAGIISLVAARRAASQGLSKASIRLCANGFVEDVEDQIGNSDSFYCKYSEIKDLSFRFLIKSSRKSVHWLKNNIPKSDLSGLYWEEAVNESGNQTIISRG